MEWVIGLVILLIVALNAIDSKNKKDAAMAAYQMQAQPQQKQAKRASLPAPDMQNGGGDPVLSELRKLTGELGMMKRELLALKSGNPGGMQMPGMRPQMQVPGPGYQNAPQPQQPQYPRQSAGYQGNGQPGMRPAHVNNNGHNGIWEERY